MMKMPRTQAGMTMGWFKGGKEPKTNWNAAINNRCLAGYDNEDWVIELNCDGDISHILEIQEKAYHELGKRTKELAENELKNVRKEN